MKRKNASSSATAAASNPPVASVTTGKHRRSYYVAITQAEQNGETTIEEIRVLPKELYSPERSGRVHDCSAYDAAIANLYRAQNGFRLTVDRGPGFFQTDLPPTVKEIARIQEMLPTWGIDADVKGKIASDLAKQAELVAAR
jgi:hypothetical protein